MSRMTGGGFQAAVRCSAGPAAVGLRRAHARAKLDVGTEIVQRHLGAGDRLSTISSFSAPRWPMRNTRPATLVRPMPSDRL